jgi:hypothetical protein
VVLPQPRPRPDIVGGPNINGVSRIGSIVLGVALLGALGPVGLADAASPVRTWQAPIGNGWPTQQLAANGYASMESFATGMGALRLELKNLVRNTPYSLTLFKGPFIVSRTSWASRGPVCADLSDGVVVQLPSLMSTAEGTIVRTIALSAPRMAAINKLVRRIALTVGSGRLARCGGFELLSGASNPPAPTPSPPENPSVPTTRTCSPWPADIAQILAVLPVTNGLCLVRYASLADAPAFMGAYDGLYFPEPPTILYVTRVAQRETPVLAHEVCHAHQDRVTRDEGLPDFLGGWYRTAQGRDYLAATGWRLMGGVWVEDLQATSKRPEAVADGRNPLEDSAGTCAIWFDPALGPRFLRRWAPTRFAWAQRWLPLPSFIEPWQGGGARG